MSPPRRPRTFPPISPGYASFVPAASLMVGTFEDPQSQGSRGIFQSREAAEEFIAGDPFVLSGVVGAHEIRGWNEILAEP